MEDEGGERRTTGLLRALRRAQLLREREAAARRRRLRGSRPRPPESMPLPRLPQRPGGAVPEGPAVPGA